VPAIGILGGSFNPPHLGHVELARQARAELGLDLVLLMPLHTPHHKQAGEDPGPRHRLAMCEEAVAGLEGIEASGLEIDRGAPSYTADTLREVHELHPEAKLTFVVGADTAATLPAWHRPEEVLRLADLAVANRPGTDGQVIVRAVETVAGRLPAVPTVRFLAMSPMRVSSSEVRERLAEGASVEDLVGARVASYIARNGLYGGRG
jgi:nicotinate-nucleotide adenylyltransferase